MDKEYRLEVRVSPQTAAALNEWRRRQPDMPNKSEAIRRLIDAGLRAETNGRSAPKRAAR